MGVPIRKTRLLVLTSILLTVALGACSAPGNQPVPRGGVSTKVTTYCTTDCPVASPDPNPTPAPQTDAYGDQLVSVDTQSSNLIGYVQSGTQNSWDTNNFNLDYGTTNFNPDVGFSNYWGAPTGGGQTVMPRTSFCNNALSALNNKFLGWLGQTLALGALQGKTPPWTIAVKGGLFVTWLTAVQDLNAAQANVDTLCKGQGAGRYPYG